MVTITKGKILWKRIRALLGRLILWWKASSAYENPVNPLSPMNRFAEGEQIPLKGLVFVVGKIVDGPLPVLLLSPVEQTSRAAKREGARRTRNERLARKAEQIRLVKRARKPGF